MKKGWEISIRKAASSRFYRIRIPYICGYFFMILIGLGGGGVFFLIDQSFHLRSLQSENVNVKQLLSLKDGQLHYFADRMQSLREELADIRSLRNEVERKLGRDNQSAEGVGGPYFKSIGEEARKLAYFNPEEALLDKMWMEMEELEQESKLERGYTQSLSRFLSSRSALLRAIPSMLPVRGGYLSSDFGRRSDPFSNSVQMHSGIDIVHSNRVPVIATAQGVITQATYNESFGNSITIYHGFGISTLYAHLHRMNVKSGDWVEKGQTIGILGNTGRSTQRHVHYEVRIEGRPVNPQYFLPENAFR